MTKIVLHALRLFEGRKRMPAGNFYHMKHLCAALAPKAVERGFDLKILVDPDAFDEFKAVAEDRQLVNCIGMPDTVRGANRAVVQAVLHYRPNIYHRPTGQIPFARLPCRTIAGVADLNYRWLKMPLIQRIYKELSYRWTFRYADFIVCVSRFTASDVRAKYGVDESRMRVIHHGSSCINTVPEPIPGVVGPFWITFGHHRHKNVENSLRAMRARMRQGAVTERLVVTGKGDYIDSVLRPMARNLGVEANVIFVGRVSDAQLSWLYKNAQGLVFMSRFEGFGLPILEAMSAGCPVISSNVCSLPEVAGHAAVTLDCDDVDGVAAAMEILRSDPSRRAKLIAAGFERVQAFSWDEAARQTLDLYEEVAGVETGRSGLGRLSRANAPASNEENTLSQQAAR